MIFNESKPIYLQITDLIADKIAAEQWAQGERIPSVRELAGDIEVNPNTVMRAYESLAERGVVFNKRGIGFFVAEGAKGVIMAERKAQLFDGALRDIAEQMALLGIEIDDVTDALKRHLENFGDKR